MSSLIQLDKIDVLIVGSGNAALTAALAALERGASVLIIEKADEAMAGGNSRYTAGAMRFAYGGKEDLMPLLRDPNDARLDQTDFGEYPASKFESDLLGFNGGRSLSEEQRALIDGSYDTLKWLSQHGVKFDPIYSRQAFSKDGKYVFWGGLTLEAQDEGAGLVATELDAVRRLGGHIAYQVEMTELIHAGRRVTGVIARDATGALIEINAGAVVLACGGFEANEEMRERFLGANWRRAKVRGTPHNQGTGLTLALEIGAQAHGFFGGCHATPMDLHMPDFGNLAIPHIERKHYRKICYFLGLMLNADGKRFVDEGRDFRNYTYAQFGRAVLDQPGQFAWQVFDAKVEPLLYGEYRFQDAHFVEAETIGELVAKLEGVQCDEALRTIEQFNLSIDDDRPFDPTIRDGKKTKGLEPPKSNWAQKIDRAPFKAYPVTGGITFTYGGLKVDARGGVMHESGEAIAGLFACGELVGGVFFEGYPGGSGLTSGAVFGRRAGYGAADHATSGAPNRNGSSR